MPRRRSPLAMDFAIREQLVTSSSPRVRRVSPVKQSSREHHRVVVARARRFLREHATAEIDLAGVARAAGASPYHFARLYHAMTGETVFATVTRFRLERGAALLAAAPAQALSISAIALEVGYQTPSAFSKAFRAALGVSPSALRDASPAARRAMQEALRRPVSAVGEPADAPLVLTGPTLRHREPVRVVFVRERGDYGDIAAPLAWARLVACFEAAGDVAALARWPHIGASHDDPRVVSAAALRYDAGLIVGEETAAPRGTTVERWPGGAHAVFEYRGPYRRIEAAFDAIARDWILRVRPPLRDARSLEIYMKPSKNTPEHELRTELWIPVEGQW